jgi:hypothetical protein
LIFGRGTNEKTFDSDLGVGLVGRGDNVYGDKLQPDGTGFRMDIDKRGRHYIFPFRNGNLDNDMDN